jgi:hypothetical protein
MNPRTSLTLRAALILLGTAASFAASAATAAGTSTDAQSMARDLLSGKSAHVVSFAAPAAATPAGLSHFDAQQQAARLLTGSLSERAVANARARSLTATTSSPVTARNGDLQEAARHLLQGQSVE